jgi:cell division protein FtsQ
MARKQARRRKQTKAKKFTLPTIPVARIVTPMAAVAIVLATYHVSGNMLDRPIESIAISGPFQRVTALQIEEAISTELDAGFIGADVGRMQELVQALPWIDKATVARRWPNRIAVIVSEQVCAASCSSQRHGIFRPNCRD